MRQDSYVPRLECPTQIKDLRQEGHPISFLIAKGKRDLGLSREEVRAIAYQTSHPLLPETLPPTMYPLAKGLLHGIPRQH